MKFFQWGKEVVKNVRRLISATLRKASRRVTSRSSLRRRNHELLYQVELLKIHNKKLAENLETMKDENILLWQHMDEMKEAERAIMKSITDELQDNLLRTLEPIGDA